MEYQWVIKTKKFAARNGVTISELAKGIGMSEPNLYKCFKRGSIELKNLENIAKYLKVPISSFFDDQPLEPFGADMEQVQPGAGLGERLRVLSANLDKATQWQARAEQLAHDNEELRAMVDAQQRTIQAHEATIEALKDNITLLKEGKAQAVGRAKAVVRGGEGEA